MSTRSRSYRQSKKQTRLSFQQIPTSSPAKDSYSPAIRDRLATVRFQGSSPGRTTRSTSKATFDHLPTPEPSSQPRAQTPPKPPSPAVRSKDEEEDEDDIVIPSSKRRRLSIQDVTEATPTRKSSRLNHAETPTSDLLLRSRAKANLPSSPPPRRSTSLGDPETSGDEDDAIITKPTARRRSQAKVVRDDPFIVDDEEEFVRSSKSRRNGLDFIVDDDEIEFLTSDESQVEAVRQEKPKSRHRRRSRREQDELKEDLEDLKDSDTDSDKIDDGKRRTRGGPVTTARDEAREHFAILKRRRAGEKIPRVIDSDEEYNEFNEDDGADIAQITYGRPVQDFEGEHITSGSEAEELEPVVVVDDEDDFVVDDEEDALSRSRSGIPLAFTSYASSKPKDLFVNIIDWLVKNKIAPAFSRNDELFALSWNKINDQIKAQAGSRLISSAWNANFKNAILARPEMKLSFMSGNDDLFANCDACNKTNHPAKYEFRFSGHAYHPDTLEPIEDDEDSIDGEDDTVSYDHLGHLLPSTNVTFNLGRTCAANAEMGHKLTHWKYHLNHDLLSYLEEQGVLSAEAVLARERLNKQKRERQAENIVDIMQETGVIDEMWRGLQDDLENARSGMEDHTAKGGRTARKTGGSRS